MSNLTPEQVKFQEEHLSDDIRRQVLAAVCICFFFDLLVVPLRFYARRKSKARLGWDDWLVLATMIPLTTYFAFFILQIVSGLGRHIVLADDVHFFKKTFIASITCYTIQTTINKASVLCFYCRLFNNQRLVRLSWVVGVFVGSYNAAMLMFGFLQCTPFSAIFEADETSCSNPIVPLVTIAILNAVVDFLMLGIPIYFISHLNMRLGRKIQVAVVFLLGGVVCIIGVVRIKSHFDMNVSDLTYTTAWSCAWSFCETAVATVCACLPVMGSLFPKFEHNPNLLRSCVFGSRKRSTGVQEADNGPENSKSCVEIRRLSTGGTTYCTQVSVGGPIQSPKSHGTDDISGAEKRAPSGNSDSLRIARVADPKKDIWIHYEVEQVTEQRSSLDSIWTMPHRVRGNDVVSIPEFQLSECC